METNKNIFEKILQTLENIREQSDKDQQERQQQSLNNIHASFEKNKKRGVIDIFEKYKIKTNGK
jgi:hypothetical protein